MADIIDINEAWHGHSGLEVESFLKRQLTLALSASEGKFGAVARIGTDLVFYDQEAGNVLGTVSLSGQSYTIELNSNLPQTFYVLADETSKEMTIAPTTTVSTFGSSISEAFPESHSYVVAINTGSGYVNRISGEIPVNGSATFDLRPFLATGDNYIRVSVTGSLSNQTRSVVYTGTLTTLTLSCAHSWQNIWNAGAGYTITGIRFAGSLIKTLHVSVNDVEQEPVVYSASQSYTTTSTTYAIPASAFPEGGSTVCSVKLWMTAQGVSTPVISYNIMCVAEGDLTPLVAINAITPTAVNYTSGTLFAYAVFNANKVSIDMAATLNSIIYPIASGIVVTGRESGVQYPFAFALELDTGANETKMGTFAISARAYQDDVAGHVVTASTVFDNSFSYIATPGSLFYMNAATRDNGAANYQEFVNEATPDANFAASYPATWSGLSWYNDGWSADSGNRRALVVPAGCTCEVPGLAPLGLLSSYPGMSIELLLQNGSPSDYDTPVLTLSSGGETPVGIMIYPTKIIVWGSAERNEDFQVVNISEDRIVHICVTFVKSYEGTSGKNLCSVYINGISNVCFSFDGSSSFGNGPLKLGQPDTDLYLYKMRVYGIALEAQAVFNNFLNCVFDGYEFVRTELTAENNVLDGDVVDYAKVKAAGYNTMVIVTPTNEPVPSFFNDKKISGTTVRFEYADDHRKDVTVTNAPLDGQGTTSMKYYRWNLRWKTADDTVWTYGDGTTETGKEGYFIKDNVHPRVDRITAKKNIASSPQGHKMGLTGLYNDLFHAVSSVVAGLPNPNYQVAVYQFPFVGFQFNTVNGQYDFIGIYTAGPDKGSKVSFGFKSSYASMLSIEGPNHAPRGTRFLCPWVDVTYDFSQETLCYGGEEGWDCDFVGGGLKTDKESDAPAILGLYEREWKPAYDCVYDNSPYIASSAEVIASLNNPAITTFAQLMLKANAETVKAAFTNGMRVPNENIAIYASEASSGVAKYDLYFYRRSTAQFEKLPSSYTNNNALTGLTSYLAEIGASTTAPTTAQIIAARAARFKATMENYWDLQQTLFHYCFCLLYAVTDNFAKNSYPQKYLPLSDTGAGNRWGWRQDDLDSVLMTDNNGTNTKKYSVEHLDTFDGVQIFQGGDSALWVLIKDNYEDEAREMMTKIARAADSLAVSLGIQGSGEHESLFNLTSRYCWEHSAKYFPATIYEKERRFSYLEPWLLAGQPRPGTSELYPSLYNGVAPLTQAVGDQYQGERLWMERRIAYIFSKYRIGAFTGTNTGYNAIVFTLARAFTFTLTPAIDLYPVVSLVQNDSQAGRTPAGTPVQVSISTTGDSNNSIHGGDWLADLGDLSGMRLTNRGGATSIDFFVVAARLQKLKIGDDDPTALADGFNATAFGVTSPTLTELYAQNTASVLNNVDLLGCPRLRKCLFAGSGAAGLLLPVGAKLTQVSFPENAQTIFMHSLPFLNEAGLTLPTLAGIRALYINNCANINPMSILAQIMATTGENLEYATLIWRGTRTVSQAQAEALVELATRDGYVAFENGSVNNVGGTPYVEGTITPETTISAQVKEALEDAGFGGLSISATDAQLYIAFEDAAVESVCLAHWDTITADGKITLNESKRVTNIVDYFRANTSIVHFDEFKYFGVVNLQTQGADNQAFSSCTNLVSIVLPEITRRVGRSAFRACSKLESINLGNVTSIGNSAFYGCSKLENVDLTKVTSTTTNAFYGSGIKEVNMPALTSFGTDTFYSCSKLERVVNLGSITSLPNAASSGYGAFRNCSALKSVVLPETLTYIGHQCFNSLSKLESINLPVGLLTVGNNAFLNCSKLSMVLNLPNLTSLGNQAFRGTGITAITSLGHITSVTGGTTSGDGAFRVCTKLTSVVLHEGITSIQGYAFAGCSVLSQVSTPSTLVSLGPFAFQSCSALQSISLPYLTSFGVGALQVSGITSIELPSLVTLTSTTSNTSGCFYNCTHLTHVDIGPNCTVVGDYAFRNCTALDTFICRATTPPTLGSNTFLGAKASMKIYVPAGYGDTYKAATNWSNKASYIYELDENGNIPT